MEIFLFHAFLAGGRNSLPIPRLSCRRTSFSSYSMPFLQADVIHFLFHAFLAGVRHSLPIPRLSCRRTSFSSYSTPFLQADVILCASGKNLDLSVGAVPKSLLAAAGSDLQTELRKNYPRGLPLGLVGKTKGYKLRCESVYHATMPQWDAGAAEACEKVIVSNRRGSVLRLSKRLFNTN